MRRIALRGTSALARGLHVETFEPRLLLSADLIPVSGSIDFPGRTDLYTFELAEERSVLFDSLTNNASLRWSLSGPGGQVVGSTRFDQSDGAQGGSILSLGEGTYTLEVTGVGDTQADYQFRLLNVGNARVIDTGVPVTGTLGVSGKETNLFQFEAQAGAELFFDARQQGPGTAYWQLVDPDGNTVFGPTVFNTAQDVARLAVPKTGIYTLKLEGFIGNAQDYPYSFTVERVIDETRDIALDTRILGELTQAGQRHQLTFSLAEDTRVIFDSLLDSQIRWSLTGPRGQEVSNRELRYSDGWGADPVLDLTAGDYTLTIGSASDVIGLYAFRLLTAASAVPVAYGEPQSGRLGDTDLRLRQFIHPSTAPSAADADDLMLRLTSDGPTVQVSDNEALRAQSFTIESWVRFDSPDQWWGTVAMKSAANNSWQDGYGLYTDGSGNLNFFVNSYSNAASTVAAPVVAGAWTHVAASYDGSHIRLYLNGELAAEKAYSAPVQHSDQPLNIGRSPGNNRLVGAIDEFRFWDTAQSAEDIAARQFQRMTGPVEGLALSLGFDGIPERDLADRADRGLTARYSEGPATETRLFRLTGAAGDRLVLGASQTGNIHYRLLGPSGQVVAGPGSFASVDPLVLPEDGDYLLLVEGHVFDTAPRDFSFSFVPKTRQELTLDVGAVVSGAISVIGEADAYGFSLAQPARLYFDVLTGAQRSDITWSLIGPRGTEVSQRPLSQSDSAHLSAAVNPVLDLPAGDYTLIVDGSLAATGEYSFRLFDLGDAPTVAFGEALIAELAPASASMLFGFDAVRGDVISLPPTANEPYGRLIDPFGRVVFANTYFSSVQNLVLPASGRYTLLVEGFAWDQGTPSRRFDFSIEKTGFQEPPVLEGLAYVPGTTVQGSIAAQGNVAQYLFTLAAESRLYFDALDYGANEAYWSLTGPRGDEVVNRAFWSTDGPDNSGDASFLLPEGTYRLTISKGNSTGAFAFRMIDLGAPAAIVRGEAVSGSLDPRSSTRAYSFDGAAGDRVVLDTASVTNTGWGIHYRIIDPWGREIRRNENIVNATPLTLGTDGTYRLLIEGRIYEPTGVSTYQFALRDVVDAAGGSIEPGETVTGAVPGPRGSISYSLVVDEATLVVFDTLLDSPDGTLQITGPGAVNRSFNLRSGDGAYTSTPPVLALGPGTYTLRVTGSQNTRPDFSFRLLDARDAEKIAFDEAVAGVLDPASATRLYRFDAEAGQVYTLADVTNTTPVSWQRAQFRLIDPFGRQLITTTLLGAQPPRTLDHTGTYLLLIEGRADATVGNTVNFGFTLQDPLNPDARAIAVGERVQGSISRPGQTHRLSFDLAEDTLLYVDSLTNDTTARLRIEGPNGLNRTYTMRSADSIDLGSSANPVLKAAAGTYTVTLWREQSDTGAYDFVVRDLKAGTQVAIGDRIEGELAPKRVTDVYRFDGTAGQSFLVDVLRETDTSHGIYWRLIDPAGNVEITSTRFQDRDVHALARTGSYTILIEGRTFESMDGAISYVFVLQEATRQDFAADIDAAGQFAGLEAVIGPDGLPALGLRGFEHIRIDDPGTDLPGQLTFALSFRPDQPSTTWTPLIHKGDATANTRQYSLWLHSGGYLHLSVGTGSGNFNISTPSNSVTFNAWNDAVAVIDRVRNEMWIYLNGELAASGKIVTADQNQFGLIYRSSLTVTEGGTYRFETTSDNRSALSLRDGDGNLLQLEDMNGVTGTHLTNDSNLGARWAEFDLAPGVYGVEIRFHEQTGGQFLTATMAGPDTGGAAVSLTTHAGIGTPPAVADPAAGFDAGIWAFDFYDTSNSDPFLLESGTYRGSGLVSDFDVLSLAQRMRGVAMGLGSAAPLMIGKSTEAAHTNGFLGALAGFGLWQGVPDDAALAQLLGGQAPAGALVRLDFDDAPGSETLRNSGSLPADAQVVDFARTLQGAFLGRIDVAGETDVYSFMLDTERWFYWDTLENRSDIIATLRGPGGVNISRALNASGTTQGGNFAFRAPAGDYTMTITGSVTATGAYGLRLLDLGEAIPIEVDGGEISGSIDMRRSAVAFGLDALAGDRLFIDIEGFGLSSSNARFRLIDPFGRQVLGPVAAADITDFAVEVGGRHTLVLETHRTLDPQETTPYRLSVNRINTIPVPVEVGGDNPGLGPVLADGAVGQALALRGAEFVEVPHDC